MFELYKERLKPESCGSCGNVPAKLLRCSSCRAVKYCDGACQRSHWRRHKKECGALGSLVSRAESVARKEMEERENATSMFILGVRLGTGDEGMPRNTSLACELYEAAAAVQKPIPGGHPVAMLHLALHCEVGIGVEQDYGRAFHWYSSLLQHPGQVGEDSMRQALLALSRFHKSGLGGAEASEEIARKYAAFAESNAESAKELKGLEVWWESSGKTSRVAGEK